MYSTSKLPIISEENKSLFKTYPGSEKCKDIYDYYNGPVKPTKESIERDKECEKYVNLLKEKERIKNGINICKSTSK